MSDNLLNLMREATAPLHAEWEDPGSLRRRAGRRKVTRQATLALASMAVLGTSGSVAFGPATQPGPVIDPPPRAQPTCVHAMIPQPAHPPNIRVFHSSVAVAEAVAEQLRQRGYDVQGAARTDESTGTAVAVIRYGDLTQPYPRFVATQVVGIDLVDDQVVIEFDEKNQGTTDLILGTRFRQLFPLC